MNKKLNEVMECVDRAYKTMSQIYVNEDDVERMAVAKQELRSVHMALRTIRDQQAAAEQKKPEAVEEA